MPRVFFFFFWVNIFETCCCLSTVLSAGVVVVVAKVSRGCPILLNFVFFFGSGFSPHFSSLFLLFPALLEERAAMKVTQQLWASAVGCISTRLYWPPYSVIAIRVWFIRFGRDCVGKTLPDLFLSFFLSSFSFSSSSFLAATFVPLGGL